MADALNADHRRTLKTVLDLAAPAAAADSGAPVVQDGRVAEAVFARSDARPGLAYAVLERLGG